MLERFKEYARAHDLVSEKDRVILAVSGGVDSVVLCHLAVQSGWTAAVAHVNFGLRGQESEQDQLFVENLSNNLNLPFWSTRSPAQEHARKQGISIQMAARELRYQWFHQKMEETEYDRIALAHHLDDNLETVLLNLTRGTGISGLRGMVPKSDSLIRPLLFASKEEIIQYARELGAEWREDSSNDSMHYQRNVIRSKVIPVLRALNPNLQETFKNTLNRLVSTEEMVESLAEEYNKKFVEIKGEDVYLKKDALMSHPGGLALLDRLIKSFGFNFSTVSDVFRQLDQQSGKLFESADYQLNLDRDYLIISPIADPAMDGSIDQGDTSYQGPGLNLEMELVDAEGYQIPTDTAMASLDLDKLSFPLTVRRWEEGDRFIPLGMKGQKKLSDFMIDQKIPVNLKKRLFVLVSGQSIAWVVGFRIDDRFKVTAQTKRVFRVRYLPQS